MGTFSLRTVLLFTQLILAGCGVVFDCTRVINDLLQNQTTPADLAVLKTVLNESRTIYYESEERIELFPDMFTRMTELLHGLGWKVGHTEGGATNTLWLAFRSEQNREFVENRYSQPAKKFNFTFVSLEREFPILIIFTWHTDKSTCISSEFHYAGVLSNVRTILNIPEQLEEAKPFFGVGYSETQIGCKFGTYSGLDELDELKFFLSIEYTAGYRFPESYYLFDVFVNSVVEAHAVHLKGLNSRYTLILNFKLSAGQEAGSAYYYYSILLSQFSRRWSTEHGHHPVIIKMSDESVSTYKWKPIPPAIKDTVMPQFLPSHFSLCRRDFNFEKIYALAATSFSTVLIDSHNLKACSDPTQQPFQNLDENKNLSTSSSDAKLKLGVRIESDFNNADEFRRMMAYEKGYFNSQHITFLLHPATFSSVIPLIKSLSNISTEIAFACTVRFNRSSDINPRRISKLVDAIGEACMLHTFPEISVIELIIDRPLDVDTGDVIYSQNTLPSSFYLELMQPKLFAVHEAFLKIQKNHPSSALKMILGLGNVFKQVQSYYEFAPELYCNDKIQKINQLTEAVITWSYIHNISVTLRDVVNNSPLKSFEGWWDPIEVPPTPQGAICPKQCNAVYLLRNYPDTMSYFETQPCVTRHLELPKEKIQIHSGGMGCRIYLQVVGRNETLLTPAELQTQLQFALHSFSRIAIICLDYSQIDSLPSTLEPVLKQLPPDEAEIIIIEVPLDQHSFVELQVPKIQAMAMELVSRNPNTTFGIVISDWEEEEQPQSATNMLLEGFQNIIQSCNESNVKIGLVIANCENAIVNAREGTWQVALYSLGFSHFLCNEKLATADIYDLYNRNNYFKAMSTFLDKAFATKVTLEREFPEKQILMGIKINASNEDKYLRTVRDVNQHAELYNMSYFAISSIDSPSDPGWWKVANKTDMSNPSGYTGTENEFLGVPTWRPPEIIYNNTSTDSDNNDNNSTQVYWIIIGVVSGVLLVAVLVAGLFFRWSASRKCYLSRAEEAEFLEGSSAGEDEGSDYLKMKFDDSFKISKVDFSSGCIPILGMGNFGTVYKAQVGGRWAAIKVPREGTSKIEFLTTLQEIKILCHVGSHPNVVSFVGAYIAEIRKGIVQIATELCENGTLLKYLRWVSASLAEAAPEPPPCLDDVASTFDLARFCMEIAAGMDHLANKKVIHGDLAARNVLLDEHNTCKIGDFGLSRKLYEYETYVKQSKEPLPWRWLAYESLTRMEFSSKSDVWSFGVTVWEIYSFGGVPYLDLNWSPEFAQKLEAGVRLQKPKFSNDEIFAKMTECWKLEIGERPTFEELGQFFQTYLESQYTNLDLNLVKLMTTPGNDFPVKHLIKSE